MGKHFVGTEKKMRKLKEIRFMEILASFASFFFSCHVFLYAKIDKGEIYVEMALEKGKSGVLNCFYGKL